MSEIYISENLLHCGDIPPLRISSCSMYVCAHTYIHTYIHTYMNILRTIHTLLSCMMYVRTYMSWNNLLLCMYVHIHTYIHVFRAIHTSSSCLVYVRTYLRMLWRQLKQTCFTSSSDDLQTSRYVCMCVCVCVCIYVCVCVCE